MQIRRVGLLETDGFSAQARDILKKRFDVCCYDGEHLADFLSELDAVFIRLSFRIDESFLSMAPLLQVICTPTTGLNHIDQQAVFCRNIEILSLKGEQDFLMNVRATPEHTFGLMLALLRNYKGAFLSPDHVAWDRDRFRGRELFGKTVGLIGFGRVGKILASYCKVFGAVPVYYDTDPLLTGGEETVRMGSLAELIQQADIVVLCASFSETNRNMIGKSELDRMKGKFFVNTSRGELIDEDYLFDIIRNGEISGVALDVLNNENFVIERLHKITELSRERNFIVTPHIAGATVESMEKTELFMTEKLIRFAGSAEKVEQ
jgi:D-3-phosphoglycerate dehydrogenase